MNRSRLSQMRHMGTALRRRGVFLSHPHPVDLFSLLLDHDFPTFQEMEVCFPVEIVHRRDGLKADLALALGEIYHSQGRAVSL